MRLTVRLVLLVTGTVVIAGLIGIAVTSTAVKAASNSNWTRDAEGRRQRVAKEQGGQTAVQAGAPRNTLMVDEVFKNIQVLKGISVDEFMGTMGIMTTSLGFCCSDCHTNAGTDRVQWEADNPRKRTARKMVQMVQALNKENFGGRQVVTCWTCHRGRDFPVVTPRLDAVYGEPVVELDDVLTRAPGVPSVQQLVDKYLAAIGGAEKLAAITSIVAKGKSVGFGGFGGGGEVELYAQVPDKRATFITWPSDPARGQSIRTVDGRSGWMATPLAAVGKYPLTAGELDGARLDAQLTFPAQITKVLTNLRPGAPDYIMGRDYYTVQGNGARNSFATLYFDRETNLLARIVRYTPSAIGRVPTQLDLSDYRDVGGIKFPHHWTFMWLDGRDNWDFTSVQFNQSIDASKFGEPTLRRP